MEDKRKNETNNLLIAVIQESSAEAFSELRVSVKKQTCVINDVCCFALFLIKPGWQRFLTTHGDMLIQNNGEFLKVDFCRRSRNRLQIVAGSRLNRHRDSLLTKLFGGDPQDCHPLPNVKGKTLQLCGDLSNPVVWTGLRKLFAFNGAKSVEKTNSVLTDSTPSKPPKHRRHAKTEALEVLGVGAKM